MGGRRAQGARAPASSRSCPRCRRTRSPIFSAHGVAEEVEAEAADARSARCSTPPARWSPRCTRRAGTMSARAAPSILIGHAGHPEVEGTLGQIPGPVHAGADRGRRRRARLAGRHAGRLRDADHARASTTPAASSPRWSAASRTSSGPARKDICYATQNRQTARARAEQAGRRDLRGRREEQLELQPAVRNRHRGRHPELSDRRRQRARAGMGQRRAKWSA